MNRTLLISLARDTALDRKDARVVLFLLTLLTDRSLCSLDPDDVACTLGMTRANVQRSLRRLVQFGVLVERQDGKHRRSFGFNPRYALTGQRGLTPEDVVRPIARSLQSAPPHPSRPRSRHARHVPQSRHRRAALAARIKTQAARAILLQPHHAAFQAHPMQPNAYGQP